jgi:hypothetical protein
MIKITQISKLLHLGSLFLNIFLINKIKNVNCPRLKPTTFSSSRCCCFKAVLKRSVFMCMGCCIWRKILRKEETDIGMKQEWVTTAIRRKGVTAASYIEGRSGVSSRPIGASPPLSSLFSSPTILEILEASILPVPPQKLITLPVQQSPVTKAVIRSSFGV